MMLLLEIIIFVVFMLFIIYRSITIYNKNNPKINKPRKEKEKTLVTQDKILPYDWHRKMLKLEEDLEKSHLECKELKCKIEDFKKEKIEIEKLIDKNRGWAQESKDEARHFKKIIEGLKNKIAQKESSYEEEFARNVKLNQELKEFKEQLQGAIKNSQDKDEEIKILNGKIERYIKELKNQTQKINEMIEKQKASTWIAKDEYEMVKADYEDAKALLDIRMKELHIELEKVKNLEAENFKLKSQLKTPDNTNHNDNAQQQ